MNPMKNPTLFRWIMGLWPPFLGAGIRVDHIRADWRRVTVSMGLRWYNRNYVGTHFGGSLFAMTDPFYMLMLLHNLGRDYRVWDQDSRIAFLKPGRGRVWARFSLDQAVLDTIVRNTAANSKYLHPFTVEVCDRQGEVMARVHKTVYIRRKQAR